MARHIGSRQLQPQRRSGAWLSKPLINKLLSARARHRRPALGGGRFIRDGIGSMTPK